MKRAAIIEMYKTGKPLHLILSDLVCAGLEYPDAEWTVIWVLDLNNDQVEEMAHNYQHYLAN
jgi:hypothetical protein